MEVRQNFAVLLTLVAILGNLAGCRSRDPSIDLLEGELRWMEDQLYMMEDELALQCDELSRCHRSQCAACMASAQSNRENANPTTVNDRLNRKQKKAKASRPTPAIHQNSPRRRFFTDHEEHQADDDHEDLAEPVVELPTLESPAESSKSEPVRLPARDVDSSRDEPVTDHRVTRIEVSGHVAEGMHRYNPQYPEGILVIVQPRNAAGQFVDKSAPVSVVVLDSVKEGAEARVARWELDALETGRSIRATGENRGLHLQLPWPKEVPKNTQDLRVFVRYVTELGDVIENDDWVSTKPLTAVAGQWMPIDGSETKPATYLADAKRDALPASPQQGWTTQPLSNKTLDNKSALQSSTKNSSSFPRPSWRPNR